MTRDPRHWQILVLTSLLVYGLGWLDFQVPPAQLILTISTALVLQAAFDHLAGRHWASGLASALISSLSLCLLLRTTEPLLAAAAAAIAIGSKFAIRADGRHVFNPTNFAIAVLLAATDAAWVSPGQWGSAALFSFALGCLGIIVVTRAVRWDVTAAFLVAHVSILVARSLWIGEPLTIPLHRLQTGSLLLFAFFMISDPKTTPVSRAGRVIFAVAVAVGAAYVQFVRFRPNGLLWSLVVSSTIVPLLNRWLPGPAYSWPAHADPRAPHGADGSAASSTSNSTEGGRMSAPRALPSVDATTRARQHLQTWPGALSGLSTKGLRMSIKRITALFSMAAILWWSGDTVAAFCGFYVAKADASLYNQSSQVVLVRDGDRTVLTMVNDFRGPVTEFAMVIPVPTFIERGQIHVTEKALVDHLDAFTAPRLVEYHDPDPCAVMALEDSAMAKNGTMLRLPAAASPRRDRSQGVTIEASYTVGEYDILILSAEQSTGLATWLTINGYRIPKGAAPVLASYIAQGMRFFVAKVNLNAHARLGRTYLRPLQVAYESPKFMLPLRLGMINADGPQELLIYALSRQGRVETTNYRTVKLPTDLEIPTYVKEPQEFARFYRAMFDEQVKRERMHAVFVEHAWDMSWCDPCAADPLSADELRELGVFWLPSNASGPGGRFPGTTSPAGGPSNVFVTRLHVRYDAAHFPEDLAFQQTGDRTNFQGRYVVRHAFTGHLRCEATEYRALVAARQAEEAKTLAALTSWPLADIRRKMGLTEQPVAVQPPAKWWDRLWNR